MKHAVFFYQKDGKRANQQMIDQAFDMLKDGRYKLEITSAKKRSSNQNAYFHGVVLDFVLHGLRDAGYDEIKTIDDAKTVVKALFLKQDIVNKDTGHLLTSTIRDTSALTTEEFMIFIDEIVKWSAEYLGIVIPAPNEQVSIF